jgi:orotidine-5'-phosphate decarboxylase
VDPKRRLAFALDYPTLEQARRGAEAVSGAVGVLKIGLELFVREGPPAVRLGAEQQAEVFLDLKLHDIPETVERAVASACELGVRYLTLHASGGPRMLEQAARRAEGSGLTLLAVTVLTSLDGADLDAIGVESSLESHALRLGELARSAGVGGLVCSAAEVGRLREALGPELVLVTPAIRPGGGRGDDQKRIATPGAAIRAGASLLVVGRPIRDSADPRAAALAIVDSIARAAGGEAA